jgi:hypothetical protein
MIIVSRSSAWVIPLAVLSGCGRTPPPPLDTGARQAVWDFYTGVAQQDWQQAYLALHPESKKRLTLEEFTRLAQDYRRNLGFNAEELHVRSCDEKGTEAIAHVVLTGRDASRQRHYRDAVVVRQSVEGWRVILPAAFGRTDH